MKYWKVECSRHLSILYQTKVDTRHITEKKLIDFVRVLVSKYALTDDEILQQHIQVPYKAKKDYIKITRTNSSLNEPLAIGFMADVADISVCVWLINSPEKHTV